MTKQLFIVMLLRRRGLYHSVWYERGKRGGWMIGMHANPSWKNWLGYSFFQAVEMIASGTLDFLKDQPENKPTHISIALRRPEDT